MSQREQTNVYSLNNKSLRELVQDLGMKRDALAALVQVTPLTINRWTTGKTRFIRSHHLKPLADALNCPEEQLINPSPFLSKTSNQQKKLHKLILKEERFDKLAIDEEYELLETALEMSFNSEFGEQQKNEICYHLAVSNYKRELYHRAIYWLDHILKNEGVIADSDFLVKCKQLRASIYTLLSKYSKAESLFDEILGALPSNVSDGTLSLLYSNYGYLKFSMGSFTLAREPLEKSLRLLGKPDHSRQKLNYCATLRLLVELETESGELDLAMQYKNQLEMCAKEIGHRYSLYRVELFELDRLRFRGELEKAVKLGNKIKENYSSLLDSYYMNKMIKIYWQSGDRASAYDVGKSIKAKSKPLQNRWDREISQLFSNLENSNF